MAKKPVLLRWPFCICPSRGAEPIWQTCGVQDAVLRKLGWGASTLDSRCEKTMSDHARGLVELSGGASNVIVGTPRYIPRWCNVTNPLVREEGGPYP